MRPGREDRLHLKVRVKMSVSIFILPLEAFVVRIETILTFVTQVPVFRVS
jgi:hypothetical protein